MNSRFCIILLSLLSALVCHAQGSHTGGGDATASDFQDYINKIDSYLLTEEGKKLFPEIRQPEFHNLIQNVKPVVKNEHVYDSFGVAQTCVSHTGNGQRYFQCDLQRLPKIDLNSQPTFYRLTFHELLFQNGMELPISQLVPSDFSISSRLKLHLEILQEWLPGTLTTAFKNYATGTIVCDQLLSPGVEIKNSDDAAISFIWMKNGRYSVLKRDWSSQTLTALFTGTNLNRQLKYYPKSPFDSSKRPFRLDFWYDNLPSVSNLFSPEDMYAHKAPATAQIHDSLGHLNETLTCTVLNAFEESEMDVLLKQILNYKEGVPHPMRVNGEDNGMGW